MWDEEDEIINESRDQIAEMEFLADGFQPIQKIKIDLDNSFSDYQEEYEAKD